MMNVDGLYISIVSAFLIGLGGSSHCLVMCGGIASAMNSTDLKQKPKFSLFSFFLFHFGRLSTYALLGLLLGFIFKNGVSLYPKLSEAFRIFAAVLMMFIALYISEIWPILNRVEKKLAFLWQWLQPLVKKNMAGKRFYNRLFLGLLWGFLPCGLIYSTLSWSSSATASPYYASVLMFAFGLGTLPTFIVIYMSNQIVFKMLGHPSSKQFIAIILFLYSLWTLASIVMPELMGHANGHMPDHSNHGHHHH